MSEVKKGDKVQLKSGGPFMMAEAIRADDLASCVWYDTNKHEIVREVFDTAVLEKREERG